MRERADAIVDRPLHVAAMPSALRLMRAGDCRCDCGRAATRIQQSANLGMRYRCAMCAEHDAQTQQIARLKADRAR